MQKPSRLRRKKVLFVLLCRWAGGNMCLGLVDDPSDDAERPSTTSQLQPDFLKVLEASTAPSRPHTSHGESAGQE